MSNWIWVGRWSQLLQLCLTLKRYGSLHGLWKTFIEECPQKVFLSFWRGPYDCRGKPRIALIQNDRQFNSLWSSSSCRKTALHSSAPIHWIRPRPPHDHRRQHWCQHRPRHGLMVGWLNEYLDIKGESVIEWTEAFDSEDAMVAFWYGLLWWVTRIDVDCCIHSRYSKASATSAFYLANKIPIEHRRPFGRQSDTLQLNFPSNMLASQLKISILECSSKFGTIHVPKLCPWSQDITSWFWCSQTWISLAKASSPGSCCKSRNCFLSAMRSLRCESAEASSSWLMQSDANCKWNSQKIVDKNENI